ncbi:hypothetical protein [Ferrimicrobium sp.]|uniref:hypothetical protein n=1 Tax=Ferrimicrobium sp. TaxID=2926050 RepID=UPI00262D5775|nr:hypothetical protein [Ferrimicrobium sp.]
MRIVSLVPHTTRLMNMGKVVLSVPPSGLVARVEVLEEKAEVLDLDGTVVPVMRTRFGRVTGVPDAEPGTFYIVSGLVLDYAGDRGDLLVPARLVRSGGRVIGCQAFARASVCVGRG